MNRKCRHIDDEAVDRFARAMRKKLAEKRDEGYSGWDDEDLCSMRRLRLMLKQHVKKGDPVDIANFCMMIWNRQRVSSKG